jgi:hypothetical protein
MAGVEVCHGELPRLLRMSTRTVKPGRSRKDERDSKPRDWVEFPSLEEFSVWECRTCRREMVSRRDVSPDPDRAHDERANGDYDY